MKYFVQNDHIINKVSQSEYKEKFGVTFGQAQNCDKLELVGNIHIRAQEAPCPWESLSELTGMMVEMLDKSEIAEAIAAQVKPQYAAALRVKAIAAGKLECATA